MGALLWYSECGFNWYLYCVGADVKPCSINQSTGSFCCDFEPCLARFSLKLLKIKLNKTEITLSIAPVNLQSSI